jgi:Tfp pilus assembly protein FimT
MGGHRPQGISLLEMMLVVNLILIVASIATPIEAVSSQPSAFSEPADS